MILVKLIQGRASVAGSGETPEPKNSGETPEPRRHGIPPLPQPSSWKEIHDTLIWPKEISVQQQHADSRSCETGGQSTKQVVLVERIRKSNLKRKKKKEEKKEEENADVTLTHEESASASTNCSSVLTPPQLLLQDIDLDESGSPLAAMATTA